MGRVWERLQVPLSPDQLDSPDKLDLKRFFAVLFPAIILALHFAKPKEENEEEVEEEKEEEEEAAEVCTLYSTMYIILANLLCTVLQVFGLFCWFENFCFL